MILDIVVLVLILISAIIAFLRGFIREALGIVTLGVALFCTYSFGPMLQPMIEGWMGVVPGEEPERFFGVLSKDIAALIVSRAAIFFSIMIVLSIVTHIFAEFIKSLGMGAVDRSLGVVFGIMRAVLLVCVLYLPVHLMVDVGTKESWFGSSKTHFYIEQGSKALAGMIPADLMKDKLNETQDAIADNVDVDSAREKLKALDLLREDLTLEERAALVKEKLESGELKVDELQQLNPDQGEGYSDEFRDTLDSLIEENLTAGQGLNE